MTRALRACARHAEHIYEIDLSNLEIGYDLTGRHLAEASTSPERNAPKIRVNLPLLVRNADLFCEEVAPHEVAHLVAFVMENPQQPWNHGPRWREVTRALGGIGDVKLEID